MVFDVEVKGDRDALVGALLEAGATVDGDSVRCPFHADVHPSGSIYEKNGCWRYKCHSCQINEDIYGITFKSLAAAGAKPTKDPKPATPAKAPAAPTAPGPVVYPTLQALTAALPLPVEARYIYANPTTNAVELVVFRCKTEGGKTFRQASPAPGGFIFKGLGEASWPIYARRTIASAQRVVVVEGEKAATALLHAGVAATTAPGGAGKAAKADWSPLAGKTVILWPDHDQAGRDHMDEVQIQLEALTPRPTISRLDPSTIELPPKGDAVEFLALYGAEQLADWLDNADATGPLSELDHLLEDIFAGRYQTIPWPWPLLTESTRALVPGAVTQLAGEPGASKSLAILQCLHFWQGAGVPVAALLLEEERSFHMLRGLTQLASETGVMIKPDDRWIRQNQQLVRDVREANAERLQALGEAITIPAGQMTSEEVAAWVTKRAEAGCRVIVVDPITAATPTDSPWISDNVLMMRIKAVAQRRGCSIVLVTHPAKSDKKKNIGLHAMAGGAAFARFSQTVVWIRQHFPPHQGLVLVNNEPVDMEGNRTFVVSKARNASIQGEILAHLGEGLTIRELGVLEHKD